MSVGYDFTRVSPADIIGLGRLTVISLPELWPIPDVPVGSPAACPIVITSPAVPGWPVPTFARSTLSVRSLSPSFGIMKSPTSVASEVVSVPAKIPSPTFVAPSHNVYLTISIFFALFPKTARIFVSLIASFAAWNLRTTSVRSALPPTPYRGAGEDASRETASIPVVFTVMMGPELNATVSAIEDPEVLPKA